MPSDLPRLSATVRRIASKTARDSSPRFGKHRVWPTPSRAKAEKGLQLRQHSRGRAGHRVRCFDLLLPSVHYVSIVWICSVVMLCICARMASTISPGHPNARAAAAIFSMTCSLFLSLLLFRCAKSTSRRMPRSPPYAPPSSDRNGASARRREEDGRTSDQLATARVNQKAA